MIPKHHLTPWVAHSPFPVRLLAFILLLTALWLPLALLVWFGWSNTDHRDIVLLGWLLVCFIGVLLLWNRWLYQCSVGLSLYGLVLNNQTWSDFIVGSLIGSVSVLALFTLEWVAGWLSWMPLDKSDVTTLLLIGLEGLGVAIAVGVGEELLFRGWLLNELDRDYHPAASLWTSSIAFAVLHFIKPLDEILRTLPQFPGLIILGLVLVWARRSRHGQLSLSIGLHSGLVWGYYLIQVGQLVDMHGDAPQLWVGIDHNPLAGGLGLLYLIGLALWIRCVGFTKMDTSTISR